MYTSMSQFGILFKFATEWYKIDQKLLFFGIKVICEYFLLKIESKRALENKLKIGSLYIIQCKFDGDFKNDFKILQGFFL